MKRTRLCWKTAETLSFMVFMVYLQGKVVRGEGKPEATAFWIHSRLHLKHPLAGCVAHTHQPWATALCCLQDMECVLSPAQPCSAMPCCASPH